MNPVLLAVLGYVLVRFLELAHPYITSLAAALSAYVAVASVEKNTLQSVPAGVPN
jgi:hypothetical protein